MSKRLLAVLVLTVAAGACASTPDSAPGSTTAGPAATAPDRQELLACDVVASVAAPDDWYRDTPVYVANEQPVEAVVSWAQTQPGYQSVWIDRERNGWITLAFAGDAVDRQRELLEMFPGVGVVAVDVPWSLAALREVQDAVTAGLRGTLPSFTVSVAETKGIVEIGVGALTADQRRTVEDRFAAMPVCLSEPDVTTLPSPGPQPPGGDGWTLLAAEKGMGRSYHTAIASDRESLEAMWGEIGLAEVVPDVDFDTHVVIWFGAVYGSGCDDLRLDDVVVAGSTVHADIVLANAPAACAGDANPFAFVVAVTRAMLPVGPFAIQLDADGPPGGVPEERTIVAADLSIPGAVATPDQITRGTGDPDPAWIESGSVVEPGVPRQYRIYVHCGIQVLGEINDTVWVTPEVMPLEWLDLVADHQTLVVSITLETGTPPRLRAVANGVAVFYEPASEPPPLCD